MAHTDHFTVSPHCPRGLKLGVCNTVVQLCVNTMSDLYHVYTLFLDILKCEHNEYFSHCAKCKEHTKNMWLLNLGASAHFTNNISDFIDYSPLAKSDRMSVKTVAHTIYVEGTGTILLKHYIANKLVTT